MRRRLNYANVTATLALFFAMSGGALAAKHYLVNSTKQINPKVLKALKGNVGAPGPTGKEGAAGKEGASGKEGKEGKPGPTVLGAITEVLSEEKFVEKNQAIEVVAKCPKGSRAISGGAHYEIEQTQKPPNIFRDEATKGRTGWLVEVGNPLGNTASIFEQAVAYCAKEGEAIAP
jgi:hypothetical protein